MDDLISRQDAREAIEKLMEIHFDRQVVLAKARDAIVSLPSAEPKIKCIAQIRIDRDDMEDLVNEKVNEIVDKMSEPKTGKWIKVIDQETPNVVKLSHYECDQCGAWRFEKGQQYCSGCGARMNWGE